jgi:hypothetical protein
MTNGRLRSSKRVLDYAIDKLRDDHEIARMWSKQWMRHIVDDYMASEYVKSRRVTLLNYMMARCTSEIYYVRRTQQKEAKRDYRDIPVIHRGANKRSTKKAVDRVPDPVRPQPKHIAGYTRRDGVWVAPHTRKPQQRASGAAKRPAKRAARTIPVDTGSK